MKYGNDLLRSSQAETSFQLLVPEQSLIVKLSCSMANILKSLDTKQTDMASFDPRSQTKVHIGGLPTKIHDKELIVILSQFGSVKSVQIYKGKKDFDMIRGKAGHPNWAVAEFEEHLQAKKCLGNYGAVSEAVGELVKIRWLGQTKKPSPFKSGNRCVDPGCQQDNDFNADACSKCGISLDLFKRPKIDDVRKADLFKELEKSSAVSPTKNPNRALIVLQQRVASLESTLKLTETHLEEVLGQQTDIDADLERIIRLRAEMIDKKIPRRIIKKHDENENLPEVVKFYKQIKDDDKINPLIENVREAYDLYEFCARRLENGEKKKVKPAIQQSQVQIVAQAAMALHLALMDYLEEFPIDKHRHVLMLIHQALRLKEQKSSDDIFDLSDLQKEIDDIIPKISNLAEPVNVYDTLRELSGSLTLIASVVTPEHDLVGFNGRLPTIKDLAKKAIEDCEAVLKTHRESSSASNNFDQAYTLKLLYSVKNHVEDDLKKYKVGCLLILDFFSSLLKHYVLEFQVNFVLAQELSETNDFDFNLTLPLWLNDLNSNQVSPEPVAKPPAPEDESSGSSTILTTHDDVGDNLSDVIIPGDDDIDVA